MYYEHNKRKTYTILDNRFTGFDFNIQIQSKITEEVKKTFTTKVARNNGYGKQPKFSSKEALIDIYKNVASDTIDAYLNRAPFLFDWMRENHINNIMLINMEIYKKFRDDLITLMKQKGYENTYGQNIMAAVNVILECVRGDNFIWLSPSSVGSRCDVRKTIPYACDSFKLVEAINLLRNQGKNLSALLVEVIRLTGMRKKEACLQDYNRMYKECLNCIKNNKKGDFLKIVCRIVEGSKGAVAKRVPRYIRISSELLSVLKNLSEFQGNEDNLIPEGTDLEQFKSKLTYDWNIVSEIMNLGGLHDIRSAYACKRYQDITRHPAPVISGCVLVRKKLDKVARKIISRELGHQRISVVAAYIGGIRPMNKNLSQAQPRSTKRAIIQAENYFGHQFTGHRKINHRKVEILSKMIGTIWKRTNRGVYKLEYNDVKHYFLNQSDHLSKKQRQHLFENMCLLCIERYKPSWKTQLIHDLKHLVNTTNV